MACDSFKFKKRCQLFVGPDDEPPSVVAMRVRNPGRSPRWNQSLRHSCVAAPRRLTGDDGVDGSAELEEAQGIVGHGSGRQIRRNRPRF